MSLSLLLPVIVVFIPSNNFFFFLCRIFLFLRCVILVSGFVIFHGREMYVGLSFFFPEKKRESGSYGKGAIVVGANEAYVIILTKYLKNKQNGWSCQKYLYMLGFWWDISVLLFTACSFARFCGFSVVEFVNLVNLNERIQIFKFTKSFKTQQKNKLHDII